MPPATRRISPPGLILCFAGRSVVNVREMASSRLMKVFRRLAIGLAIAVVVLAATAGWFYHRVTRGGLPTTSGTIEIPGLSGRVTVRRDRWGTPHIAALQLPDLYFAQGYVTAQDRLWQMDVLRRDASGRLAELVGAVAFDRDVKHRTLGLRLVAERALPTLAPDERADLDAFAAGVNAYIDTHRDALPLEFRVLRYAPEHWEPVDSLVIGKLMAETLGTTYQNDLMRADFADLDPQIFRDLFVERSSFDVPFVGTDSDAASQPDRAKVAFQASPPLAPAPTQAIETELLSGSNDWVVAASRSADGHPLLANDPHLALALPPIWYAVHLTAANGDLDVAGVTFPGAPGITIGHNRDIAWGVTNFGPDVQDLYAEVFDENGMRYRVGDGWQDADVRSERVVVRREGLEPTFDERTVRCSEHPARTGGPADRLDALRAPVDGPRYGE